MLDLFLSPFGRIGRSAFWMGEVVLIVTSVLIILAALPAIATKSTQQVEIYAALQALVTWCHFAILAKRLHDRNRSALWIGAALFPVLGAIWLVAECGFFPSVNSGNSYGLTPAPKLNHDGDAMVDKKLERALEAAIERSKAGAMATRAAVTPDAPTMGRPSVAANSGGRPVFGRRMA